MNGKHSTNFIRSMNNWIFLFNILFLLGAVLFIAMTGVAACWLVSKGQSFVAGMLGGLALIEVIFSVFCHKVSMIFYEYMRADVSATLEVKSEVSNLIRVMGKEPKLQAQAYQDSGLLPPPVIKTH